MYNMSHSPLIVSLKLGKKVCITSDVLFCRNTCAKLKSPNSKLFLIQLFCFPKCDFLFSCFCFCSVVILFQKQQSSRICHKSKEVLRVHTH